MDWWADSPEELERAASRTLLAVSAITLGALALPGLFSGEWTGKLLVAGALLIAAGAAPIGDTTLQRRAELLAAGAALVTWLLAIPLFEREGMIVPALMSIGCAAIVRALLAGADEHLEHLATQPPAEARFSNDGWIEEDGRQISG